MDELRVGDKIKDNDPRMGTRILTVVEAEPGRRVKTRDWTGRIVRLARERIFTDAKPRRSGFSRISTPSRERGGVA